jgi:hypothetical protein
LIGCSYGRYRHWDQLRQIECLSKKQLDGNLYYPRTSVRASIRMCRSPLTFFPPLFRPRRHTSDILSLPSLFDLDMYLAVLPHGFADRYQIFIFFILTLRKRFN